jgi:hypothetical protein
MSDEELVKRLRERQEFEFIDEYKRVEWEDEDALEAADRIEYLSKKIKLLEKTDMWFKTNYPEHTGYYFICGEGGTKDDNGLPERLHVCPAYGADWMMVYTRTDKTSGPEY